MSARLPLILGSGARRVLFDLIDVQLFMDEVGPYGSFGSGLRVDEVEQLRDKLRKPGENYTAAELQHLHETASAAITMAVHVTAWERTALLEVVRRIEQHT